MTERIESIVTNESDGYGYKYASLSDIAKQGYTIPKMKTDVNPINGKEYVYYFDKDVNDWVQGAQVVIPESKSMNASQLYGSALTYCRRYTTLLALGLACQDDQAIEEIRTEDKATEKQIMLMKKLYSEEELQKIADYYHLDDITGIGKQVASKYIDDRMGNRQ